MEKQKATILVLSLFVLLSASVCVVQHNRLTELKNDVESIETSVNAELSSKDSVIADLNEKNGQLKEENSFANAQLYSYDEKDFSVYEDELSNFFAGLSNDQQELYSYAYSQGYQDADVLSYEEGYSEGQKDGEDEGYSMGEEYGREKGYEEGYNDGYADGFEDAS